MRNFVDFSNISSIIFVILIKSTIYNFIAVLFVTWSHGHKYKFRYHTPKSSSQNICIYWIWRSDWMFFFFENEYTTCTHTLKVVWPGDEYTTCTHTVKVVWPGDEYTTCTHTLKVVWRGDEYTTCTHTVKVVWPGDEYTTCTHTLKVVWLGDEYTTCTHTLKVVWRGGLKLQIELLISVIRDDSFQLFN